MGVAEEARFGPGYQLKGLMFGGPGNLSDGSALVTGKWGPKLQPGDTLDMGLGVTENAITLSFCQKEYWILVHHCFTDFLIFDPRKQKRQEKHIFYCFHIILIVKL